MSKRLSVVDPLKEIAKRVDACVDALPPHLHEVVLDDDGRPVDDTVAWEQQDLDEAYTLLRIASRQIEMAADSQRARSAQANRRRGRTDG